MDKYGQCDCELWEDIIKKIEPIKVRPVMPKYWREVRLDTPNDFCPYCGANLREDNDVSESV